MESDSCKCGEKRDQGCTNSGIERIAHQFEAGLRSTLWTRIELEVLNSNDRGSQSHASGNVAATTVPPEIAVECREKQAHFRGDATHHIHPELCVALAFTLDYTVDRDTLTSQGSSNFSETLESALCVGVLIAHVLIVSGRDPADQHSARPVVEILLQHREKASG